ncbi:uncharacterized protein LOC127100592 [Lathyrus oleraceus]|uniref:uncharacterized protein LOC127100592 n=1 Tax=Pisum sativum TaxID=3888 RepID=UPI0021D218E7|nr:uncharacterized protein LOC127100592 [Pisum sativum]
MRQLMETIQVVDYGQEIMANMQEEMNQRAHVVAAPITTSIPMENPVPPDASVYDAFDPPTNEVENKFKAIEEKLKELEGSNDLGLDTTEICLVPSVVIPTKFKVTDFEKYKGASDPITHVKAYCRKMASYSDDNKLLMHLFQDSLKGASLDWYKKLEGIHIRTWRDMAEAFLKHYQYNADMVPNRTQLQNLTQKSEETFKEYTQRWRELATRVQPPLLERELIDMFMGNLQGPYLDRMLRELGPPPMVLPPGYDVNAGASSTPALPVTQLRTVNP